MTPEKYIEAVVAAAQKEAGICFNNWRSYLSNKNTKTGNNCAVDRCQCKSGDNCKCIVCPRCSTDNMLGFGRPFTLKYNHEQPFVIHGPAGDYDALPEVYLGMTMTKPWTTKQDPFMHDLLKEGTMLMTEDEILAGISALLEKYPRVAAWISMKPLRIALLARMRRLIPVITELLERRALWFLTDAPFEGFSETLTEYDISYCNPRLDLPPSSLIGAHNIPLFLRQQDYGSSTMNINHAVHNWVDNLPKPDSALFEIVGRALACNATQMREMECCSMNGYPELVKFISCISHCQKKDGRMCHTLRDNYDTPFARDATFIMYHTLSTRCPHCPLASKCDHDILYGNTCKNCVPDVPVSSLAIKPYECVIANVVAIRRRRLRGVFYCAAVLIGKAREMHYRPGIGSVFTTAMADFYALCDAPTLPQIKA
jgi:hypothetical protein